MIIVSPQYGTISLDQIDYDSKKGPVLPGSNTFFCNQEFGTITVQEFKTDHYSFRFAVLNLVKKISFIIKEETFFLKSTFALDNPFHILTGNSSKLKLKKGQHIICTSSKDQSILFEKQNDYNVFQSSFSFELLEKFFEAFPSLKAYADQAVSIPHDRKIEPPSFVSPETKKIIHDILNCPYDQTLRRLYFENKVNDLVFEILLQSSGTSLEPSTLTQRQTEAVFNTRNIIMQDITRHYSVKELSAMVRLSQVNLKTGFKKIFGTGIFEYLLQARMKKAYHLVTQTNKPIKEIAAEIGFDYVANFVTSFDRRYGKTPSELRKK